MIKRFLQWRKGSKQKAGRKTSKIVRTEKPAKSEDATLDKMRRSGLSLREAWARLSGHQKLQAIDEARVRGKVVKIFVENDAMAFFNAGGAKPIDINAIDTSKHRKLYGEHYNERVPEDGTRYYNVGKRKAPIITTSVVNPCIVFLAYALNEQGVINRAGVFHLSSHEKSQIKRLIDGVSDGGHVYVKVAGSTLTSRKNQEQMGERIRQELSEFGNRVTLVSIELGGPEWQTIETYPMQGIIRTFWRKEKEPLTRRV